MPARAAIASGYRWRLGLIGLVCLLFAGWSFLDGYYRYPKQQKLRKTWEWYVNGGKWKKEYERIRQTGAPDWEDQWKRYAHKNLVLDGPPQEHKPDGQTAWNEWAQKQGVSKEEPTQRSDNDIYVQYGMLALVLPIALYFLFHYVRSARLWVACDDQGLSTSGGASVPFGAITQLNKERWKSKGIAVLKYKDPAGAERSLLLDDWKYEALPTQAILRAVEERLTDAQIVGGERERKPDPNPAPAPPSADTH